MKPHYHNAIIPIYKQDEIGTDNISTREECFDEESVIAQIELWANRYVFEIQKAWIDV